MYFQMEDKRATEVVNSIVKSFLDTMEQLEPTEEDEEALVMALGIVTGILAKKAGTDTEVFAAVIDIAQQTYDAARIVKGGN